jgi:hypothetical protein
VFYEKVPFNAKDHFVVKDGFFTQKVSFYPPQRPQKDDPSNFFRGMQSALSGMAPSHELQIRIK